MLHFGSVFVSDYFVRDPVEDVKDEKGQRKSCSGNGVDPLCSVHKLPLVVLSRCLLHAAIAFCRYAILHTCSYAITREVETSFSYLLLLDIK